MSNQEPSLTEIAAFKHWLSETTQQDVLAASNAIYKRIGQINKSAPTLSADMLQQMAISLTPPTLALLTTLEKAYLKNHQQKIAQLNVALSRQLALLHTQAGHVVVDHDKSYHYNCALQLQGMAHYQSVLSYDRPSTTLWAEMGLTFQAAINLGIVAEQPQNLPDPFKALNSIDKAIKRNLLFSVSNAYPFTQTEIQKVFIFCGAQQHHVQLDRVGENSREGFCWNVGGSQLPYPLYTAIDKSDGLVFNLDSLFRAHRQSQIQWPMDNPVALIDALSRYKSRLNPNNIALPTYHVFIPGQEQTFEFFSRHIRGGTVSLFNSPSPESLNFSSLEVVQEERRKTPRTDNDDIWGKTRNEKLKLKMTDFGALKTYKTDTVNLFGCEAMKAKLVDQDILGLYGNDMKPRLAIVRRLEPETLPTTQKALIEMIPGTPSAVQLMPDTSQEQIALLITQQQTRQLIVAPQKLSTGSRVPCSAGMLTLDRLLQITDHFLRYQVSLETAA